MFVGHGLLAFALAAAAARWRGWSPERALALGLAAGAFGLAPDVDVLYAPVGLLGAHTLDGAVAAFWTTGNAVHRSVTHSLLVAAVAAPAVALWTWRGVGRAGSLALLGGLVGVSVALDGPLAGIVMGAFALAGLCVAHLARHRIGPRGVLAAAAIGLASHPVGDLLTGSPPAMLYPLDATLVAERVTLHPDPTLHLLGAFGAELATAWLALLVYARLAGRSPASHLDRRAATGLAYAGAALVLPAPTLEVSYQFVFSILAVGGVGLVAVGPPSGGWLPVPWPVGREEFDAAAPWVGGPSSATWTDAAFTGLTAVTLAGLAYSVAYLVV